MSDWQYLDLVIYENRWADSNGRSGCVSKELVKELGLSAPFWGQALNEIGHEGWELCGWETYSSGLQRLLFKRSKARARVEA